MKVMFGMMTIAICLLAFTMMNNQSQQAYAGEYVGGGDRGTDPTIVSPTIVSFRVTQIHGPGGAKSSDTHFLVMWRMWSDGAVEVNLVGSETILNSNYGSNNETLLHADTEIFTGWKLVADSVTAYASGGVTTRNRQYSPIPTR